MFSTYAILSAEQVELAISRLPYECLDGASLTEIGWAELLSLLPPVLDVIMMSDMDMAAVRAAEKDICIKVRPAVRRAYMMYDTEISRTVQLAFVTIKAVLAHGSECYVIGLPGRSYQASARNAYEIIRIGIEQAVHNRFSMVSVATQHCSIEDFSANNVVPVEPGDRDILCYAVAPMVRALLASAPAFLLEAISSVAKARKREMLWFRQFFLETDIISSMRQPSFQQVLGAMTHEANACAPEQMSHIA